MKPNPSLSEDVAELMARAATYHEKPHLLYSHIAKMTERWAKDEPQAKDNMLARYDACGRYALPSVAKTCDDCWATGKTLDDEPCIPCSARALFSSRQFVHRKEFHAP